MIDIQSVYIRDFIRLQYVEPLVLIRVLSRTAVRAELFRRTQSVRVGGSDASFFSVPSGDLLINVPSDVYVNSGLVYSLSSPGLPVPVVVRSEDPITGELVTETISNADIQLDDTNLRVQGQDFSAAVQVLINRQPTGFVVLSKNYLVCSVPAGIDSIETLEVVASSNRITGTSFFSYFLGSPVQTVSGVDKLTGQFIKLLLTTTGTDTFNPEIGGDLQKWSGSTTDEQGNQAFARLLTKVLSLGARMTAGQVLANLPPEETLAFVEVLDIRFSPVDPTEIELAVRLTTLAGQVAAVNILVGKVAGAIQQASAGVVNA